MKSAIATIGMLAAAASAYSHHPRHLHFPRANNTAEQTTLTVIATQIHTVTSCAPTVTNCPAHSTGIASLPESQRTTFVVTDTVTLATTVCPVTEASSVSASIISQATSSGALPIPTSQATIRTSEIHPSVPLSTGVPGATTSKAEATSLPPGLTTTTTDVVTSKTLTMTLGTGTDASVVTTTIQSTVQKTITVPCSPTTDSGNKPTGPAGTGKDDTTTTTTATSKITRTITISKTTPTNTAGVPGDGGNGGNGGNGDCSCPAAQTVTVTAPASTVYVTIGGGNDATQTGSQPAVTEKTAEPTAETTSTPCPESTTTSQVTVTVVPFPTGNGTHTSGTAGPSGFARLRR